MLIYCCSCEKKVNARLTDGSEIYPHRQDLYDLPFWKCDNCGNYVGCHHKTKNRTSPLGHIPSKEIMEKRKQIHSILDPLWKSGRYSRKKLYARLSELLGWNYHTAMIRSVEEANKVLEIIKNASPGKAGKGEKFG
jgi:hypothetical protein